MLEEEDYEFPLTDDDIRVAVRRWLDTPPWKQRLKIVDEMSPGGLRAYHESLPDTLLKMSADEGVSYGDNLSQEANAALDHSEYLDVRSGERLRRTAVALQRQLREYVDRRMDDVFGQEPKATATLQSVAALAPSEMHAKVADPGALLTLKNCPVSNRNRVRLILGIASGFRSERRPVNHRNLQTTKPKRLKSTPKPSRKLHSSRAQKVSKHSTTDNNPGGFQTVVC